MSLPFSTFGHVALASGGSLGDFAAQLEELFGPPNTGVAMIPIQSSQIHSVGYEPNGSLLRVRFKDKGGGPGQVYEYEGVPEWIYKDLIDPEFPGSKGSLFTRVVKGGGFVYRKVKEQ